MKLLAGQRDPFSGRRKALCIHTISRIGIVVILGGDGAFISWGITAVANKWRLCKAGALFEFKIVTNVVADGTGATTCVTEKELFTGIGFSASKTVDAKIMWIIETAPIPGID